MTEQNKWVKASYNEETKTVVYSNEQGTYMLRSGGSLAWRLNNPGNLRPLLNKQGMPAPVAVKSHVGFAKTHNSQGEEGYFLIFPDIAIGREEIRRNFNRLHHKKTLEEAMHSYASKHENDTDSYIEFLEKKHGLNSKKIISDFNADDFEKLLNGITEYEGFYSLKGGPQKEIIKNGTNITLSDGVMPIPNKEVKIVGDKKEFTVKSSKFGKLPPIIDHGLGHEFDVLIKDVKGEFKKIAKIDFKGKARNILINIKKHIHIGSTGTHLPKEGDGKKRSRKGKGAPLHLIPQPGEAPWMKIAYAEYKEWKDKDETQITLTRNYHQLIYNNQGNSTLIGNKNAWCASFVNYCLKNSGYHPTRVFQRAASFKHESDLFFRINKPIYGCICWVPRSGGSGHVCFVLGEKNGKMVVLGGNQSKIDQITFAVMSKNNAKFYLPVAYHDIYLSLADIDLPHYKISAKEKLLAENITITHASSNPASDH